MSGLMGGWMSGWMGGWMGGWMDGWVDGWMDGWVDGWVGGCVDGRVVDESQTVGRRLMPLSVTVICGSSERDFRSKCKEGRARNA